MPKGVYKKTKEHCKKISMAHMGKQLSEKHKKSISLVMSGKNNPMYGIHRFGKESPRWKGGKRIHKNGYIEIKSDGHPFANYENYVYEHRLVMEKKLGRYLKPEERTHHLNGIKDDNRPENLKYFPNESKHQKFHQLSLR